MIQQLLRALLQIGGYKLAKSDFIVTYSDTHVNISIKRKTAARLAILLEDAGDWFGNSGPEDLGLSSKAFEAAGEDVITLTSYLTPWEM